MVLNATPLLKQLSALKLSNNMRNLRPQHSLEQLNTLRDKEAFICDMDGVLYHGNHILPGAIEFIHWLEQAGKSYLFLTNSGERTPRELSEKLKRLGISVDETHFYTSALATAQFLASQKPGGSAYVIGNAGLTNALYEAGYSMNDIDPDYVIISETPEYNFARMCRAIKLVRAGAKLIGTNPDMTGPIEGGDIVPATGALMAPIQLATGAKPYFIGKPNPLIMRNAITKLGVGRKDTAIIGDRMDTDIIAGIEAGMMTILVLTGVTREAELFDFAYQPDYVLDNIGCIIPSLKP